MSLDAMTIERSCPLCHDACATVRRRVDGWALARCNSCGFLYAPTVRSSSATELDSLSEGYEPVPRARHAQILRLLKRLLPTGSTIVDVGAGFGTLGLLAEADGSFRYIGFEPSVSVSRAARSRGVDLRPELFTAASLSGEADAIVLDNVLEHLNDPIAVLREARAALRAGGVLVVIVPNRRDVRQVIPRWRRANHWIPPEHINYFTSRELSRSMTDLGMTVRPFGLTALGRRDWPYWPRGLLELVGCYPFGLNVYGTLPTPGG